MKNKTEIYKLLEFLNASFGKAFRADRIQLEKLAMTFKDCDAFMFHDAVNWCSKHYEKFPCEKQISEAYQLKSKLMGDTAKEKQEQIDLANNQALQKKAEKACIKKFGDEFINDFVKAWVLNVFSASVGSEFCYKGPALIDLFECNFDLEKVFDYSREKNGKVITRSKKASSDIGS